MNQHDDIFGARPAPGNPPVEPDWEDVPDAQPGWPKGIGITSIVLASLGLACGAFGLASLAMQPMFMDMVPPEMAQHEMSPAMTPGAMDIVGAAIGLLGSLLLLAAGIATVMRSLTGRWLHLLYGAVKYGHLLLGIWALMQNREEHYAWAETQPADNPWAQPGQFEQQFYVGIGMMLLLVLWPTFCIIWFGFVKTKHEDFTGGIERAA